MANENKYFLYPFADSGTKTDVPDESVSGAVGYNTGYGADYELAQGETDRKRIERPQYNAIMHDITSNLKQHQERTYPTWVSDIGDGTAFPYSSGSIVDYNGDIWVSTEGANTDEPTSSSVKWASYNPVDYSSAGETQETGLVVHPPARTKTAAIGDIVAANTSALRNAASNKIYLTSEDVSGEITALSFDIGDGTGTATIGGSDVTLNEYWFIERESKINLVIRTQKERWNDRPSLREYLVGDGSDESSSMTQAMTDLGGGDIYVPQPETYYSFDDIEIPEGTRFIFADVGIYNPQSISEFVGKAAFVKPEDSTSPMFAINDRVTFDGGLFWGRDQTSSLFTSAGGSGVKVSFCRFHNSGMYQWDRALGMDNAYFGALQALSVNASNNVKGAVNLVDSLLMGGYYNVNTDGIVLLSGSNDNSIIGVKSEFNTIDNIIFDECINNTLTGGVTDRAGRDNIRVRNSAELSIAAHTSRRAGRYETGYNLFVSGVNKLLVNGLLTNTGTDDDGSGTDSPDTALYIAGTNGDIVINASDLTGNLVNPYVIDGSATYNRLSIRDCTGSDSDFVDGMLPESNQGQNYQDRNTKTTSASSTEGYDVTNYPVNTFSRQYRKVSVYGRRTDTGQDLLYQESILISREGSGASIVQAGDITGVNSSNVSVSFANVATDASTFTVNVQNLTAGDMNLTVEVK